MRCIKCGQTFHSGAKFCPSCGAAAATGSAFSAPGDLVDSSGVSDEIAAPVMLPASAPEATPVSKIVTYAPTEAAHSTYRPADEAPTTVVYVNAPVPKPSAAPAILGALAAAVAIIAVFLPWFSIYGYLPTSIIDILKLTGGSGIASIIMIVMIVFAGLSLILSFCRSKAAVFTSIIALICAIVLAFGPHYILDGLSRYYREDNNYYMSGASYLAKYLLEREYGCYVFGGAMLINTISMSFQGDNKKQNRREQRVL